MACRKAAYRAMTELSEWMAQQQEEADAKIAAMEAEQRKIWTPTELFDTCCTQWLAFGPEILQAGAAGRTQAKGCSGGCGKAHPRITLDYEQKEQSRIAVAIISHELDPFMEYFEILCQQGLAKKIGTTTTGTSRRISYHLLRLPLHQHADRLLQKQSNTTTAITFGSHLIKVSANALANSKRSHERQTEQEEIEREAKRRRKMVQTPATDEELFERALEVCYNHSLMEHLDVADIAWMRQSCKTMAKYAAKMASKRLQQLHLSYSILLDGQVRVQYQDHDTDDDDEQYEEQYEDNRKEGRISLPHNNMHFEQYTVVASHLPLLSCFCHHQMEKEKNIGAISNNNPSKFIPKEVGTKFGMYSGELATSSSDRRGHLIRLYLEQILPTQSTGSTIPEKDCFLLDKSPLEIARHRIDPDTVEEGEHTSGNFTYTMMYVDDNNNSDENSNHTRRDNDDDNHIPAVVRSRTLCFCIKSIQFGFQELLGIFVRKKYPQALQKMREIKRQRPLTRLEKEYVKALAKEVREAPGGTAQAFQGMKGW